MGTPHTAKRRVVVILFMACLFLIVAFVFYGWFIDRTITTMYKGQSLAVLNHQIHNTDNAPLSYYLLRGRALFSRLIVLGTVAFLGIAAALSRNYIWRVLVEFFTTPTSPLNLAIFCLAVFGTLLLQIYPLETIWFGEVPHELQIAPFGMGWLLPHLPISQNLVAVAVILLYAVSLTAFVGWYTRTSALLAAILAFYVLGISQFFGKVSHDHHLLWFLIILAASRSGDALSLDAIRAAIKRADQEITQVPVASITYSLPLRFASLLLGVVYFFPGLWKLWDSGFDWALSDNLKYQMYSRWMDVDGWSPLFRLDWHPFLYKSVAFGTMRFEISFVFLVLFPRLRAIAALGGVIFHVGSVFFMDIFFWTLITCYVALFDVSTWLK